MGYKLLGCSVWCTVFLIANISKVALGQSPGYMFYNSFHAQNVEIRHSRPRAKNSINFIDSVNENQCLERHARNIEIWPWRLGGKNSSIFIDFVKEDQCRERPAQNMEIRPWKLRARKSSICIDFAKENTWH